MSRAFTGSTRSVALSRSRAFQPSILNHITQRDMDICVDIYQHRFLTTRQIFEIHFTSEIRARVRTHELYLLGVLDRFRPPQRPGSAPWHYVLDRIGAEIVSGVLDSDVAKRYFENNRPQRLARSPRLEHMRAVNDFFTRLIYAARQSPGYRVKRWWGERKSAANCHGIVNPDGIGTLRGPKKYEGLEHRSISFFLELDRGTEESARLERKVDEYAEAAISPLLPRILIFSVPNERRERYVRDATSSPELTIATAIQEKHLSDPLGYNWLPLGFTRRVPLIDLWVPKEHAS